jgi:RimJ/RimL family protein N-acetyltransferase
MESTRPTYVWGAHLPSLRGTRVALRGLEKRDAPSLFEIFGDSDVMRYWSSPPLATPADADILLREIQECLRSRTLFQWGIARIEDDRVIGTCTLFRLDSAHRRAEIGFALARECWGRGFATEAVGTLIRFAFVDLDLHRLEADADPRNERSLRLLERLGFRREGYFRERYHLGGEVQDAVMLGLLRTEWPSSGRA